MTWCMMNLLMTDGSVKFVRPKELLPGSMLPAGVTR
jgi:hypothetical protein